MSAHHRTAAWSKVQREARPIIAATLPRQCVDCPRLVTTDQPWDIGHIVSVANGGTDHLHNLGPSHTACNRSAGGRDGRARQLAGLKQKRRLPTW